MFAKRYLRYLFFRYYKVALALLALGFILFPLIAITTPIPASEDGIQYPTDTHLYMGTTLVCTGSYLLPLFIRAKFTNRKKCDLFLSLPLSAKKIYVLDSLFAFIVFWVSFTLLFFVTMATNTIKGFLLGGEYGLYYASMFVLSLTIFAETSLIASLANNVADAILMLFSVELIPVLLINIAFSGQNMIPFLLLEPTALADEITVYCQDALTLNYDVVNAEVSLTQMLLCLGGNLLLGVGAFALSYCEVKKFKSENAGDLTTKWYSYPLINTLLFTLLSANILPFIGYDSEVFWLMLMLIIAFYFVLEFIYQRKIKVDKWTLIRLAIVVVGGIGLGLLLGWLCHPVHYDTPPLEPTPDTIP